MSHRVGDPAVRFDEHGAQEEPMLASSVLSQV
jgi:hypothetical protein